MVDKKEDLDKYFRNVEFIKNSEKLDNLTNGDLSVPWTVEN